MAAKNTTAAKFQKDQLVFAKVTGFPHWPAKITGIQEEWGVFKYDVVFYGTYEIANLAEKFILDFVANKAKLGRPSKMTSSFKDGMDEIENDPDIVDDMLSDKKEKSSEKKEKMKKSSEKCTNNKHQKNNEKIDLALKTKPQDSGSKSSEKSIHFWETKTSRIEKIKPKKRNRIISSDSSDSPDEDESNKRPAKKKKKIDNDSELGLDKNKKVKSNLDASEELSNSSSYSKKSKRVIETDSKKVSISNFNPEDRSSNKRMVVKTRREYKEYLEKKRKKTEITSPKAILNNKASMNCKDSSITSKEVFFSATPIKSSSLKLTNKNSTSNPNKESQFQSIGKDNQTSKSPRAKNSSFKDDKPSKISIPNNTQKISENLKSSKTSKSAKEKQKYKINKNQFPNETPEALNADISKKAKNSARSEKSTETKRLRHLAKKLEEAVFEHEDTAETLLILQQILQMEDLTKVEIVQAGQLVYPVRRLRKFKTSAVIRNFAAQVYCKLRKVALT